MTLPQLPTVDASKYSLSPDTWTTTVAEIKRVRRLIQDAQNGGRELEPDDVKDVKDLYKQVTDIGDNYSKALKSTANAYKKMLVDMLEAEHYSEIDQYINTQKEKQRSTIANRIAEKIDALNTIITNKLESCPNIASTNIPELIPNAFIKRFPKINSGAANNNIKKWEPIKNVIETHLDRIENLLIKYPVLRCLPLYSESMKAIINYLNTSDTVGIDNIEKILESDRAMIETVVLKNQLQTEDDVLKMVGTILSTDEPSANKITKLKKIIDVWLTV